MLRNIKNQHGRVNAANQEWNVEKQVTEYIPCDGAVVETDQGGCWQILGPSDWLVEGWWRVESAMNEIRLDGMAVEVTGRTVQRVTSMGYGVRVKITFKGDGEPDTVTRGWMKVG